MADPYRDALERRRRELSAIVHSPALISDQRNGDADARRVLDQAAEELARVDRALADRSAA